MLCFVPRYQVRVYRTIGPLVEGVFTIYGRGGHLGHVTIIMSSDIHFLVPETFHKNLVQIGTAISEKNSLIFLCTRHFVKVKK